MASSSPRILLLGGHGKVSQLLTPKLLSRNWTVISTIRDAAQSAAIHALGANLPGKLEVLVHSLEDVKTEDEARAMLEESRAEWIVWSAGAGGRGGAERTNAIDRDACKHFIRASTVSAQITKFLLVSALSSRRSRAPWWHDEDWALVQKMNEQILPVYYRAKLAADEALVVLGTQRVDFGWISLRPGQLVDEAETAKVSLGKTAARGQVSRGDVAEVALRLLEIEGVRGWFDVLGGDEEVSAAVERVVVKGVNCFEGEDLGLIKQDFASL